MTKHAENKKSELLALAVAHAQKLKKDLADDHSAIAAAGTRPNGAKRGRARAEKAIPSSGINPFEDGPHKTLSRAVALGLVSLEEQHAYWSKHPQVVALPRVVAELVRRKREATKAPIAPSLKPKPTSSTAASVEKPRLADVKA